MLAATDVYLCITHHLYQPLQEHLISLVFSCTNGTTFISEHVFSPAANNVGHSVSVDSVLILTEQTQMSCNFTAWTEEIHLLAFIDLLNNKNIN